MFMQNIAAGSFWLSPQQAGNTGKPKTEGQQKDRPKKVNGGSQSTGGRPQGDPDIIAQLEALGFNSTGNKEQDEALLKNLLAQQETLKKSKQAPHFLNIAA